MASRWGDKLFWTYEEWLMSYEQELIPGLCLVRRFGDLICVAVVGVAKDWSVYVSYNSSDTPMDVADHGLKLTEEFGRLTYPDLARRLHWRS